jgi:dephospho-CoA kinase
VQSGLAQRGDANWLVTAEPEVRVRRLMERDTLDFAAATKRVAAAIDPTLDASLPVIVIDNSGNQADLRQRVYAAWQEVTNNIAKRQKPERIANKGENR